MNGKIQLGISPGGSAKVTVPPVVGLPELVGPACCAPPPVQAARMLATATAAATRRVGRPKSVRPGEYRSALSVAAAASMRHLRRFGCGNGGRVLRAHRWPWNEECPGGGGHLLMAGSTSHPPGGCRSTLSRAAVTGATQGKDENRGG